MADYTLTVKKDSSNASSPASGTWSATNSNGWQQGDTLTITWDSSSNSSQNSETATNTIGLCVGACAQSNSTNVQDLLTTAGEIGNNNTGELIPGTAANPNAIVTGDAVSTAIFYNATSSPQSGNVTSWTMDYNADNSVESSSNKGKDVEIIFSFGDPHAGKVGPPVK